VKRSAPGRSVKLTDADGRAVEGVVMAADAEGMTVDTHDGWTLSLAWTEEPGAPTREPHP